MATLTLSAQRILKKRPFRKAPNVDAPAVRNAIGELERRGLATGRVHKSITLDTNRERTIANITVPIEGTGTDAASNASLAVLRDVIVPETVGTSPAGSSGSRYADTGTGFGSGAVDGSAGSKCVEVIDQLDGNAFRLPVAGQLALDVIHHPYAFAPAHEHHGDRLPQRASAD